MEFSGENEILRGAFRLVSHVTVHFVLYPGNCTVLVKSNESSHESRQFLFPMSHKENLTFFLGGGGRG